jgi:hypothetical protein
LLNFVDVIWLIPLRLCWGSGEPPLIKNSPPANCQEAEQEFNLIKEEYLHNPKLFKNEIDPEAFRSLINGLFQAEGHIGAYFPYKDSLKSQFILAIGQNYSKEAVILLLQLQHALGGIGQFKLELASTVPCILSFW